MLRYWLALKHAPGVGPTRAAALIESYGSPRAVFEQSRESGALGAALRDPDWAAVDADLAWAAADDCHLLCFDDPLYPTRLRDIADPPPVLYVRGDPRVLDTPQVAMVGSRNPSPLGQETARAFARHLAGVGLSVTSGLALGIDAEAHQGALDGGGGTVAVFGTGTDRIYPARHRQLAHAIVDAGGALVSELSPDMPPRPAHFPRRNRIISGLSLGTLVVEAAPRSGSLITARLAAEQGREVFAIPGSIHNPLARGCHRLIREGAKLVECAEDVLEELAPQLLALLESLPAVADKPAENDIDADQRRLLACVDHNPVSVDMLVDRSGLTADVVSSILLHLELQGYVVSATGGYARTAKRA